MSTSFQVSAWRRPANIGMLLMVAVPVELVCIVASVLVATKYFGATPEVTRSTIFPLGMFIGAALVGLIAWVDHRLHPAGTLTIQDGRVRFDGWAPRRYDFPLSDVKKTVISHAGLPAQVLVVFLANGPRLFVHGARLRVPLEDVMKALVGALPASQQEHVAAASSAEVSKQATIGKVVLYAAGGVIVLNLLRALFS